ncbi:unnamed protein product [Rotaria sp. Silwood2]|nr:unnamed protein product [Rotaria sp. Silwood2]
MLHVMQVTMITPERKLEQWKQHLCRMYEIYPELTDFSYEQFQIVESVIYKIEIEEKQARYHLLKYIGFEPTLLQQVKMPPKSDDENERLENLDKILITQRSAVDDLEEMKKDSIVHTVSTFCCSSPTVSVASHLNFVFQAEEY